MSANAFVINRYSSHCFMSMALVQPWLRVLLHYLISIFLWFISSLSFFFKNQPPLPLFSWNIYSPTMVSNVSQRDQTRKVTTSGFSTTTVSAFVKNFIHLFIILTLPIWNFHSSFITCHLLAFKLRREKVITKFTVVSKWCKFQSLHRADRVSDVDLGVRLLPVTVSCDVTGSLCHASGISQDAGRNVGRRQVTSSHLSNCTR